jgi:Domain of Unknown Function (DUF1080)
MTRSHHFAISAHESSCPARRERPVPHALLLAIALTTCACSSDSDKSTTRASALETTGAVPSPASTSEPPRPASAPASGGSTGTRVNEQPAPGSVPLTGPVTTAPASAPEVSAPEPGAPRAKSCWTTNADGSLQLDPQGKITLFDGSNLDAWRRETGGPAHWTLLPDQTMQVASVEPPTDLQTKDSFESVCLHLEYLTPSFPPTVTGQNRGNSGIYFESAYEAQVLDSIGQPAGIDTCGAIYGVHVPLAVACKPELVWNTYEIEYRAAQWQGDVKTKDAVFVLSVLNGTVVQRDVTLGPNLTSTTAGNPDAPGPQPLMLQDHRNPVKFRNIWLTVPPPRSP